MDLIKEINHLKKGKNAVILVHNYQRPEIYKIGDFIGDSLELARKATETDADIIIFCGVDFMAESAKILNPSKRVFLPAKLANCPMAGMAQADAILEKKRQYDDLAVVSYINTNAETKAVSDMCCTSANSVKVVNSLKENNILFVPDMNLAKYTQRHTQKKIIPWVGHCYVHNKITKEMVQEARKNHPAALVVAHPECTPEVIDESDEVASTGGMVRIAKESEKKEFIMVTECGMCERLKELNPDKKFYSLGTVCLQMKKNSLENVYKCLKEETNEIFVEEAVAIKARAALERMLELS